MKMKEAAIKARQTGKAVRVTEGTATGRVRIGISIKVDHDVLSKIKSQAAARGMPYQTFINSVLFQAAHNPVDEQIKRLEAKASHLEESVERIEHQLKSKAKGRAG